MWARGDMKIQIPQQLGLTRLRYELRFYNSLKSRYKKGAVVTILSWLRPLP